MYIPVTGLAIYGCLVGLGRLNEDLNAWQQSEAIKIYVVWILLYVVALATVKSSVCITIRRIASIQKPMRIAVWCLLALTWASFFVTFIGTITYCNPTRSLCKQLRTSTIQLKLTQNPRDTILDHQRTGWMRTAGRLPYYRPHSHRVHHCDRYGARRCARAHPVEHADEAAIEDSSLRIALLRLLVRSSLRNLGFISR